jgi:hypothetical protein
MCAKSLAVDLAHLRRPADGAVAHHRQANGAVAHHRQADGAVAHHRQADGKNGLMIKNKAFEV